MFNNNSTLGKSRNKNQDN